MIARIWAANILGWPLIHLSVSFLALRLPAWFFERDNWLTAPRSWESDGIVYRNVLAIRSWKSMLPDGAPWLGGFRKNKISQRDSAYLRTFVEETRRAELAHWCMLCCLPIFFLWNPPWACLVMTVYAVAANLPCILAQRYNRIVLIRVLEARRSIAVCL